MVDKVRPLKIEAPTEGGTQTDYMPTETKPSEDYVSCKGIALEESDSRLMDLDASGNIQFTDATQTTAISVTKLRTALNNTFDNTTNGFVATDVQTAIEEARFYPNITRHNMGSTTPFVTSSRTDYVVVTGLAITPIAGEYLVLYNASVFYTTVPKAHYWACFVGGTVVDRSIRQQDTAHSNQTMVDPLLVMVGVDGSQAIDIRVKCADTGTLTVGNRSFTLIKVG